MTAVVTVAVTGLQAACAPAPGLEAAFCLSGIPGLRVVGIDYDPLCTGLYATPPLEAAWAIPSPLTWMPFQQALEALIRDEGISILIPGTDLDVVWLARHRAILEGLGIRTLLPGVEAIESLSKAAFFSTPTPLGPFSRPRTRLLRSPDDCSLLTEATYPVWVKGRLSGAHPAGSPAEAAMWARSLSRWMRWPILVQDWIEGEELSLTAVASREPRLLGGAMIRKLGRTETGTTWAGVTIHDPEIVERLREAVATWRWVGPIDLDLIRTSTGELFVVDINPRLPAWTAVARDAGANLPAIVTRVLCGEEVEPVWAATGTAFAQYADDLALPVGRWLQCLERGPNDDDTFYRRKI